MKLQFLQINKWIDYPLFTLSMDILDTPFLNIELRTNIYFLMGSENQI